MQDAVFGNVGTIISFALGAPDARVMAQEFAPYFTEEDIINLDAYNVYMELMVEGMSSRPFSAVAGPLPDLPEDNRSEEILEKSRKNYGRSKERVVEAISKWSRTQFDLGMAKAEEARKEAN